VDNGFFVHFFAPEGTELAAGHKEIVFVLDRSGSMVGTKYKQTKNAVRKIFGELREEDRFNIVIFDHEVEVHKYIQCFIGYYAKKFIQDLENSGHSRSNIHIDFGSEKLHNEQQHKR